MPSSSSFTSRDTSEPLEPLDVAASSDRLQRLQRAIRAVVADKTLCGGEMEEALVKALEA